MHAMQVNRSATGLSLLPAEIAAATPGPGEVLIRVRAAGGTPTELLWYPTTHTQNGAERHNAIPGHEFSGTVEQLGAAVGLTIGEEVYGMNDWFAEGATAELCLASPSSIAPKPSTLSHEEAATVPIGGLTAMQGLFDRAHLEAGERVLIHGGAGAVGLFAVQLAHLHGAHVTTTASARHRALLESLGATLVIDYKTARFEDLAQNIDVVFDTVGGETLARSWAVLKPGGRLVTIAADAEASTDPRLKDIFFIVEPNRTQLLELTRLLDTGTLKTFVDVVVPFEDAPAAYARTLPRPNGHGKVVITLPRP